MMSELLIAIMVIMMSAQTSSLVSSLILVPTSVLLMILLNVNFMYSGLVSYIFIMVFIGGLMVLLVSVASTVSQEQGISSSVLLLMVVISSLLLMFLGSFTDWGKGSDSESIFSVVVFLDLIKVSVVFGMLLMLIVCLFVLTKLLLEYQGLTRNL